MSEEAQRISIVSLHQRGKTPAEIIKAMDLPRNNRSTVYRTIKNFKVRSTTARAITRTKTDRRKQIARNVRDKIHRNPLRSQRKLAAEYQNIPTHYWTHSTG